MDSLTQIALGAAVAESTLGRKLGNKAIIFGAVFGTLPDLDVLIRYADPIANFTYHRGFSHSIIILTLVIPLLILLLRKIDKKKWLGEISNIRLGLALWLVLVTHALLDALTVYGTQLLWPYNYPFGVSSIFIIDPFYTVPLLVTLTTVLFMKRQNKWRSIINKSGLIISSLYIIWSIGVKAHVDKIAIQSLADQNIEYGQILSVAAPFNTFLWRFIVMDDAGYYEGYYSIFDKSDNIKLTHHQSDKSILGNIIQDNWAAKRFAWFTHGFYSVKVINDEIVVSDLRMGNEESYVFTFALAKIDKDNNIQNIPTRIIRSNRDMSKMGLFWDRIFDEEIALD